MALDSISSGDLARRSLEQLRAQTERTRQGQTQAGQLTAQTLSDQLTAQNADRNRVNDPQVQQQLAATRGRLPAQQPPGARQLDALDFQQLQQQRTTNDRSDANRQVEQLQTEQARINGQQAYQQQTQRAQADELAARFQAERFQPLSQANLGNANAIDRVNISAVAARSRELNVEGVGG
jgi:hypothetical protein